MPQTHFRPPGERLCVVKVKLTNALGIATRPDSVVVFEYFAGFLPVTARLRHRRRQTVWSSRGEGWGCHPDRRDKDQHRRGRASSEPSLVGFIDLFDQLGLFLPGIIRSGRALEALAVERAGSTVPGCLSTVRKGSRFPKTGA